MWAAIANDGRATVVEIIRYGEYGPDLVELMGNALDQAWERVQPKAIDAELARLVMASAITTIS